MTTPAKLTLAIALLATALFSSASASTHRDSVYYDTIRPHGHPRSATLHNASVDACSSAAGQSRTAVYDSAAFKQCMLSRGYRFEYTRVVQDPPTAAAGSVAQRSYAGPGIGVSTGRGDDSAGWSTPNENSAVASQNDDEQSAIDAANAGYAQDAATAAANVAAAASFDAQMTVGN